MSNSLNSQVILDGPRNFKVKIVGILDTSDLASTTIIDPSTMSVMSQNFQPDRVRIERIVGNVENGLEARLFWDATSPVYIGTFTGHGHDEYEKAGGLPLPNPEPVGTTGKILLTTQGWNTPGDVLSFTLEIECVKTHGI